VLTEPELSPGQAASADVLQAQEDVRAADMLTAIYPLWWLSMPAIMKGYIDRMFARGFAYDFRDGMVAWPAGRKESRSGHPFGRSAASACQKRRLERRAHAHIPLDRVRTPRTPPFRWNRAWPFEGAGRTASGGCPRLRAAAFPQLKARHPRRVD